MENAHQQVQSTQTGDMQTNEMEGGTVLRRPPEFQFGGGGGALPDGGEQYEEYGATVAEMAFADLLADLQRQDLGFLGGLRCYLTEVKNHRIRRPSRLLAGTEAVVGHAFSPSSLRWFRTMATEADKTAIRALTGSNFDWVLAETAPQGTEGTTVVNTNDMSLDPGFVARKQVFHELWLFEMSKQVQAWAEARVDPVSGTATFGRDAVEADAGLLGGMLIASNAMITADFEPAEDTENWQVAHMLGIYATIEVDWILRFMVYHGLLTPAVGGSTDYTYTAGGGSAGAAFEGAYTETSELNRDVYARLNPHSPENGLFESTVINPEQSSSAEASDVGRSFATTIMPLFNRMERDPDFALGTYASHNWGQFSADIYFTGQSINYEGESGDRDYGYWWHSTSVRFFEHLSAAAEMDESATGGAGKFGWVATYNHQSVADEVNRRFGEGRIRTGVDGHGPAISPTNTDGIHIHLDIRPMSIAPDSRTGYSVNANGRLDIP